MLARSLRNRWRRRGFKKPSARVAIMWVVDAWWAHKAEGKPYAGNTDKHWFSMKDGGASMAPYRDLEAKLPENIRPEVEDLRARIIAGSFEVPIDVSDPKAAK